MWKEYNPNPAGRIVGDCAVRAISAALGMSWEEAYATIAAAGFTMCDMPSSNSVWGAVLRQHGFSRAAISTDCDGCYTAADFAADHHSGVYVLGFGDHVATMIDGVIYDTWDCSSAAPQYYWHKEMEKHGV